jgi:hypothetical protein
MSMSISAPVDVPRHKSAAAQSPSSIVLTYSKKLCVEVRPSLVRLFRLNMWAASHQGCGGSEESASEGALQQSLSAVTTVTSAVTSVFTSTVTQ